MVLVASHPVEQLIVQRICERDALFSDVRYLRNGEELLKELTINENILYNRT